MIANCQWVVSKPVIRIFFPNRFVEDRGKGSGFLIEPVTINTLIIFKAVIQILQVCSCGGKCHPKGHKVPLGYLLANVLFYLKVVCFIFMFGNNCLFL